MTQKSSSRVVEESLKMLGQIVQTARKEAGLTRDALAVKAGVGRNTIMRLEKGNAGVGVGVLLTVIWLLDIPLLQGIDIGRRQNRSQIAMLLNSLNQEKVQRVRTKKEKYDANF